MSYELLFPGRAFHIPLFGAGSTLTPYFFRSGKGGATNVKLMYQSTTEDERSSNGIGGSIDPLRIPALAGAKYMEAWIESKKKGDSYNAIYHVLYIRDSEHQTCFYNGHRERNDAIHRGWSVDESSGEYFLGYTNELSNGYLALFFTPQSGSFHFEWRNSNTDALRAPPKNNSEGIIRNIIVFGE